MNKELDILKKVIEKAETHWLLPEHEEPLNEYLEYLLKDNAYYSIIFSHEFAKAFFGEFCVGANGKKHKPYDFMCTPEWLVQLQNMVVEKNPIYFLKKFL